MKSYSIYTYLGLAILGLFYTSCQNTVEEENTLEELNIRVVEEPDRIHPMLSRTGIADQIEQRIYMPLLGTNPKTFDLEPAIATAIPDIRSVNNGGVALDYEISQDAVWCDNVPITAKDVLFTLKMIFLPEMDNPWRSYFNLVDSLIISEDSPNKFTFLLSEPYILAIPATASLQPYPQHLIDPEGKIDAFSLQEIRNLDSLPANLESIHSWFVSDSVSRYNICGSGPYSLEKWNSNQYLQLDAIEDHWTKKAGMQSTITQANPKQINYLVIPEEANAIAQLKNGNIDILSGISPGQFQSLQADTTFAERHHFYTPSTFKQYIILMNNQHTILKEKPVRKAISALTDRNAFIEDALGSLGMPSTSPIHPDKSAYYEKAAQPQFDPEMAADILEQNGWLDLDEDGFREKIINGKKTPLKLTFLSTGSALGNAIGLRLKDNAQKVGVEIQLEQMPFKNILAKMRKGEFDMSPLSISTSPFPDDPYQSWHTDNIGARGSNLTRFGSDSTDQIIEQLRVAMRSDQQLDLYQQFQIEVAKDVPAVFIAAPRECIISKGHLDLVTGPVKPGYAEQLTQINQNATQ